MSKKNLLRGALALGLVAAALPAAAQTRLEIQGARSYMDSHGTNAAFVEAVFAPHAIGSSRFTWSPDVSAGWIEGRDIGRFRDSNPGTDKNVGLLAGGARFHYGDADSWYQPLFFSFQVAGTTQATQALSSHYQFVSTLGWQAKYFTVGIRHISNGSLHEPNRGETMALVGFAFDL